MTFKTTSTDAKTGLPVSGPLQALAAVQDGRCFSRSADGSGYSDLALLGVPAGLQVQISIIKEGYAVWSQAFTTTDADQEVSASLIPFDRTPRLPAIPTRDDVCSVRLHFQGVEYQDLSIGPSRGVILWALPDADRHKVIAQMKALGDRHMVCSVAGKYYNFNTGGGFNYANDLPTLKARLRELIVAGFVPLFSFSMDGQQWNPDGWTFGWSWGMQGNMERIIRFLQADEDLTPYILFFHGFELVTPPGGNWTPVQFEAAVIEFRRILPNGHLAEEIGTYAWWGEGEESQGAGPVATWNNEAGMGIDVALGEWNNPVPRTDPAWRERRDGMEQIACRWLGPYCNRDAMIYPNANDGPWYWPNPTPRGRRYAIAFEMSLAAWVRDQISLADLQADQEQFRQLGFLWVC